MYQDIGGGGGQLFKIIITLKLYGKGWMLSHLFTALYYLITFIEAKEDKMFRTALDIDMLIKEIK